MTGTSGDEAAGLEPAAWYEILPTPGEPDTPAERVRAALDAMTHLLGPHGHVNGWPNDPKLYLGDLRTLLDEREQLLGDDTPIGAGRKPLTKRELSTIGLAVVKPVTAPARWDHETVHRLYWTVRHFQGSAITAEYNRDAATVRAEQAEGEAHRRFIQLCRVAGIVGHADLMNTCVELEPGETPPTISDVYAQVREVLDGDGMDSLDDSRAFTDLARDFEAHAVGNVKYDPPGDLERLRLRMLGGNRPVAEQQRQDSEEGTRG